MKAMLLLLPTMIAAFVVLALGGRHRQRRRLRWNRRLRLVLLRAAAPRGQRRQQHVFSSGFSHGGAMTYAPACARPAVFRAVAVYSGANVSGCGGGTRAIIWDCNGQSKQQWNVNTDGTVVGVRSGLCLDANGAGTVNGSPIVLWTCNGGSDQKWARN